MATHRSTSPSPDASGQLPPRPLQGFVGRAQELAEAERLLGEHPHLVVRGEHGEGKTAFAVELARRLLKGGSVQHVAFLDAELRNDVHGSRYALGQQLVPQYPLALTQGPRFAAELLERVLREQPTLVVIDRFETVLPPDPEAAGAAMEAIFEPARLEPLLDFLHEIGRIGRTRLLITSTVSLPEPFEGPVLELGPLAADDAEELLERTLTVRGLDASDHEEDLASLADAVEGHAASLTRAAEEAVRSGGAAVAEQARELHAKWRRDGIDPRRRAALVGVELALRRLDESLRRRLPAIAAFHHGSHLTAIAAVLGLDVEADEEVALADQLIDTELAEILTENYLRLHPLLGEVLRPQLDEAELGAAQEAWAESVMQLVGFLHKEQIKNPQLASGLALADLRNLLACLAHTAETVDADAEAVMELADAIEALVGPLGRPRALAWIERIRSVASRRRGEWDHATFLRELGAIESLLDIGHPDEAVAGARKLLHHALRMGEQAYDGAAFDLATLHLTLGLAKLMAGENELAKGSLEEAQRRFHLLAREGDTEAARMEITCFARLGDALRALAFHQVAGETYERAVERAAELGERHQQAEIRLQLGNLYLQQGRPGEALPVFDAARALYEALGEPQTVARIWRQVGAVRESLGELEAAEAACREALHVEIERGDRAEAAVVRGEIGALQASQGQFEAALESYRRAAEVFAELDDLAREGVARSQAADKLMRLERWDDARQELRRAVECDTVVGHAAEPWHTWSLLNRLEEAVGDHFAAAAARERAIEAYLRYRRDGGESQTGHGEIFIEVAQAIRHGRVSEVGARLEGMLRRRDLPKPLRALIPALLALLRGSRDPALTADPELYYRDAAELLLQIESLERIEPLPF